MSLLGTKSFKDREPASQALVKMGNDIVPLLKKYLSDADPEVRYRVQSVIEQIAPGTPTDPPLNSPALLDSDSPQLRR